MKKAKRKIFVISKIMILLGMVFLCLFPFMFTPRPTFAENIVYTSVLEDLKKDEKFDESQYPVNHNDHSLKVIQIAESVNGELFVYVYQPNSPNKALTATSINISTAINDSLSYKNYKLSLLSSVDTLYKFKVVDFVVKEDVVRYYDISSIFRAWNEKYDSGVGGDNTINEVSFEVGYLWTFVTLNGEVSCSATKTETIEITGKYVGFIRYRQGFVWHEDACDSHFVAFSTDKPIDTLLEADVEYVTRTFSPKQGFGGGMLTSLDDYEVSTQSDDYVYGEPVPSKATIKYTDEQTITVGHVFRKSYTFNRIESVSDFRKNTDYDFSNIAEENLQGKDWVLRFAETDYHFKATTGPFPTFSDNGTKVEEVSIMRLKFETNGVVYNLGVVDNKQTGSDVPSGKTKTWFEKLLEFLKEYWWLVLLGLVVLFIVIAFLPSVLNFLFWLLKVVAIGFWYVLKGIWWVVSLPFRIFKKDK